MDVFFFISTAPNILTIDKSPHSYFRRPSVLCVYQGLCIKLQVYFVCVEPCFRRLSVHTILGRYILLYSLALSVCLLNFTYHGFCIIIIIMKPYLWGGRMTHWCLSSVCLSAAFRSIL